MAQRRLEHAGDGGQHAVTSLVAVTGVERFEIVDVDDDERQRLPSPVGHGDLSFQLFLKVGSVVHPGQEVVEDQPLEPDAGGDEHLEVLGHEVCYGQAFAGEMLAVRMAQHQQSAPAGRLVPEAFEHARSVLPEVGIENEPVTLARQGLLLDQRPGQAVPWRGRGPVLSRRHLQRAKRGARRGHQVLQRRFHPLQEVPRCEHAVMGDETPLNGEQTMNLVVAKPGLRRWVQRKGHRARLGNARLERQAEAGPEFPLGIPQPQPLMAVLAGPLHHDQLSPFHEGLHEISRGLLHLSGMALPQDALEQRLFLPGERSGRHDLSQEVLIADRDALQDTNPLRDRAVSPVGTALIFSGFSGEFHSGTSIPLNLARAQGSPALRQRYSFRASRCLDLEICDKRCPGPVPGETETAHATGNGSPMPLTGRRWRW